MIPFKRHHRWQVWTLGSFTDSACLGFLIDTSSSARWETLCLVKLNHYRLNLIDPCSRCNQGRWAWLPRSWGTSQNELEFNKNKGEQFFPKLPKTIFAMKRCRRSVEFRRRRFKTTFKVEGNFILREFNYFVVARNELRPEIMSWIVSTTEHLSQCGQRMRSF